MERRDLVKKFSQVWNGIPTGTALYVRALSACSNERAMAKHRVAYYLIVMVAVSFLFGVEHTMAQVPTAVVVGTVTDSSGAVVPSAQVTIENLGTHETRSSQTNSSGDYVFNLLQPGHYEVDISAPGFRQFKIMDQALSGGDTVRLNAKLQLGVHSETVQVTAQSPLLQTDTSSLSTTWTNTSVVDLPLNGRNFIQTAQLSAGANEGPPNSSSNGSRPDDRRPTSAISINGQSEVLNDELIDGMDNNERVKAELGVAPSIDAIQEFQVQTLTFAAEYGRTVGGVVNVVTKAGTNQFHGSAYEFFRNNILDASNYSFGASLPKSELRQNQYGASLGGPIRKNKTFFFGDYEGFRLVNGLTRTATVPTLFELQNPGNFSDVGGPIVPTISPIALNYFHLFPDPNLPGAVNNFVSTNTRTQYSSTFDGRIDHHFNSENLIFGRFTSNDVSTNTPGIFPPVNLYGIAIQPGGQLGLYVGPAWDKAYNFQLNYEHIFSPNLIMQLGLSFLRLDNYSLPANFGLNASEKFGIPGINVSPETSELMASTVAGYGDLGDDAYIPLEDIDTNFQYMGNITYTHGNHNIKIGAGVIRRQVINLQPAYAAGYVLDVNAATPAGNMANFLSGQEDEEIRSNQLAAPHYRTWEPYVYAQDDWRILPNLTLNLGVRYDTFTAFTAVNNQISNFDPATGQIIIAGQNGVSATAGVPTSHGDVAPRVGFSLSLGHGMVLFGGYGINYFPSNYSSSASLQNQPFVSNYAAINQPISAGLPPPSVEQASVDPLTGSVQAAVALNYRDSSVQQFNLTIQKEVFKNNVVTIGYVGVLGRHLADIPDINAATPNNAPNPNTFRPYYNQWPDLTYIGVFATEAVSSYNSLQASVDRRLNNGLVFNVNYNYAQNLSNAGGAGSNGWGALPNQFSTYEYGNSGLAIRHRIAATGDYMLPFGKTFTGLKAAALKSWQLNAIVAWETGLPFTIVNGADISNTLPGEGAQDRPNQILHNASKSNPGVCATCTWFNVNAFAAQAPGTVGNTGPFTLFGPRYRHVDFSVNKDFQLPKSMTLQFRAESFNLTNTVNYAAPNSTLQQGGPSLGGFGTMNSTSALYNPRQIQFALKLLF